MRRVDAEEHLAVGSEDLANGHLARLGVAGGELDIARLVRVQQL